MEEKKNLFRCPLCYRGDVVGKSNGNGTCTNCKNEFTYYKKTDTYFPKKYNKRYGNEKILANWREIYREYQSKKGLPAVEWDALAHSKAQEFQETKKYEEPSHDGIETSENPGWAGAVLWPFFIPIVGFIIGIVRMAKGQGERKKSGILCFLLSIFFMVLYIWIVASLSGGCYGGISNVGSSNPYIASVKGGYLESYPSQSVGSAVNVFISRPKWDTGITEDGQRIVNVTGEVLYMDEPAEILIQFMLHEDDSFEIYTMELNDIPINRLEQMGFIEAMYGN
jgi:hypothetical protein